MDFERDYWHDEYLKELVEDYRKNRDPTPLTNLIHQDVGVMSAPVVGRLFLDMINGNLEPLSNCPNSTTMIRKKAVELVQFYLGMDYKKTLAYKEVGDTLFKSEDTIRGYVNDWLTGIVEIGFSYQCIDKKDFWKSPEKYLAQTIPFSDGREMIDDQLAMEAIANYPKLDIESYRKLIKAQYTTIDTAKPQDPWEAIEGTWPFNLALAELNNKNRE